MDEEYFEERAAIAEYDGGLSRKEAEKFAREQEEERFRCEVRQMLTWKTQKNTQSINLVLSKRHGPAKDRLLSACRSQWDKGNRGEKGVWFD